MKSDAERFEELSEKLKTIPHYLWENEIRRFLSSFQKSIQAWRKLIELACLVENKEEAVSLSYRCLEHFPDDSQFFREHVGLLLGLGHAGQALQHLQQITSTGKTSPDLELDLAELYLSENPPAAQAILAKHLEKHPGNFLFNIALASARSIIQYGPPKICFLLGYGWHYSIQQSVMTALDVLQIPYCTTSKPWVIALFQPSAIVVSDTVPVTMKWIRQRIPQAKIVNTRHGIGVAGKNYGLYSAAATHFICVTSEPIKRDLSKMALIDEDRIWVTGFSQMDGLFRAAKTTDPTLPRNKVLFAPTFDSGLSAFEVIGENPVRWIRGNNQEIILTIRPHPHLFKFQPALIQHWRSVVLNEPNVIFDDNPATDLSGLLVKNDLLVTDVSSVALQFIALDRPIICVVDMEKARLSPKYAPDELEWKMHAASVVIHRKEDLPAAVDAALRGEQSSEIIREKQQLREYIFGDMTDGQAGERIAARLVDLAYNG